MSFWPTGLKDNLYLRQVLFMPGDVHPKEGPLMGTPEQRQRWQPSSAFGYCILVIIVAALTSMFAELALEGRWRNFAYQRELERRAMLVTHAGTWYIRDRTEASDKLSFLIEKGKQRIPVSFWKSMKHFESWRLIVERDTVTLAYDPDWPTWHRALEGDRRQPYTPEVLLASFLRPMSYVGAPITNDQALEELTALFAPIILGQ